MNSFPLKVETVGEPARSLGLFDSNRLWVTLGCGHLEMPLDYGIVMAKVAALANAAYERGKSDAKSEIREALGLNDE